MKSPATVYKDILKEYEISEELQVHPQNKLLYLREQRDQQKAIINRLTFDMATAKVHMDAAKDDITKEAHRKKFDDYVADLRQLVGALKINLQLLEELGDETVSE